MLACRQYKHCCFRAPVARALPRTSRRSGRALASVGEAAMNASTTLHALALTSLGAAGTALGGVLVCLQPQMDFQRLGVLQGLAGGLMLSISIMELLPDAISEVGFVTAQLWFYAGVAFFAVVVACIPEPDSAFLAAAFNISGGKGVKESDDDSKGDKEGVRTRTKILMSGLITALGIALHNFPEGIAVFLAAHKSSSIGLSLALAIALHNIPEGVAVALPVYFATGSRMKGFNTAAISGLAEPLAVVVLALLLPDKKLPYAWVEMMLAAVGGIMAFIALHELLPLAIEHAGKGRAAAATFAGMALMSFNLYFVHTYFAVE
ncbi:MAG: ZIP family transporter [Monoraphidium minutum]|nr:MAG: ZIP family transporter [Monoraphidium minutum]